MSRISIGAMNQLGDALENAGFTPDEITKLKQFKDLKGIKAIINGRAEITYPIVDCDADPFIPEGWRVEKHHRSGLISLSPASVSLYLSDKQINGVVTGNELSDELSDKPVMNANILDYLLVNQKLIPEEWKGKLVFFWGTVYISFNGLQTIRCLVWDGMKWISSCEALKNDFYIAHFAALINKV